MSPADAGGKKRRRTQEPQTGESWWRSGAWKSALPRVVFVGVAWWALCDGDSSSLTFGLFVVAAVSAVSFALSPPRLSHWRLTEVARFAAFFLAGSIHGGFDVARRALLPGMPISPVFVRYRIRLPTGAPRTLFRITLNLMPGTLSADVIGDALVVHALVDRGDDIQRELAELEVRVARVFGLGTLPSEPAHA